MSKYKIIKTITLQTHHIPTGKTVHYQDDDEISGISQLQIIQYDNDHGYYLFYLDSEGKELTDTYHDTITQAMEQASFEFNVLPDEWVDITV